MAKKILTHLDKNFERYIMAFLLAVLVCAVSYDVIMRYVFNNGQAFVQEFSRYTMLYITFLGISYGVRYTAHLRADFIPAIFPKTKKAYDLFGDIVMIVFGLLLIIYGWPKIMSIIDTGQASAVLRFPTWLLYFGLWIGWVLAMGRFFQKYFLKAYRFRHGIEEEQVESKGII